MDFIWIIFAFCCGLGARIISLPPLIGYLLAGFLLNYLGLESTDALQALADLGITLMLFTIGLKLNASDLLKTQVWGATLGFAVIWIPIAIGLGLVASALLAGWALDIDIATAALLAFAFSFSSTVCVVKLLEENGEMNTRHGRLAIAILVMQDILAVFFLVAATGKTPSPWAIALLLLLPARPLLNRLLDKAGHGELLPLTGFFLAMGGYELFNLVNIKGDLGALLAGVLLSSHSKSTELNKALLSFKDIFLIGFFLNIGLTALPDTWMLLQAILLSLLLPLKMLLFFSIFVVLRLRARSSFLAALALANYSEFGLIVTAISVNAGWLEPQWLVILAIAVALSFVVTNVFYHSAHQLYSRYKTFLKRFEHTARLQEDIIEQPRAAEILVIGMGRVGKGAFDALYQQAGDKVWGMDADRVRIEQQKKQGLHVFVGDGEDADLWENIDISSIKLVLLALPSIEDNCNITRQLLNANFRGRIAAIARYEDEREHLLKAGIDKVFNFYNEAGIGFAEESLALVNPSTGNQFA